MPDFVCNAVMDALNQAARVKEIKIWKKDDNYDVNGLADLFAVTQMYDPDRLEGDTANTDPAWTRLAKAVSEIVTNPTTPVGLYNYVMDFLNGEGSALWSKLIITPPMIQKILIEASVKCEESPAN